MQTIEQLLNNPSQFIHGDGVDYLTMEHEIESLAYSMEFTNPEERMKWMDQFTRQLQDLIGEELRYQQACRINPELRKKKFLKVENIDIQVDQSITNEDIQLIKNSEFKLTNHIVMETDLISKDIWNGESQRVLVEKKECIRFKEKVKKNEYIETSFFIYDVEGHKTGKWDYTGRELTEYERRVHDAYVSLLLVNPDGPFHHVCSIEMLYRVMYGIPNGVIQMTKKQINDINRAMHLIGTLIIRIDATNEDKLVKRYENINAFQCDDPLISIKCVQLKEGSSLDGTYYIYQSKEMPPLYQYASRKNQLHSEPIRKLSRIKGVNNTQKNTMLRNWFERRIDAIEHSNHMSNIILVETLMQELGYIEKGQKKSDYPKRKRHLLYKKLEQILDDFINRKEILGYEWLKDSKNLRDNKYRIKLIMPDNSNNKRKFNRTRYKHRN